MCGICGFIGERDNKEEILKKMLDAIRHRGPDSDGIYITENASLGFCRLSIIDLENGDQPMYNEDRSLSMVFNGEIYNYQELRKRLTEKEHTFITDSDSETLIHGYEEWGEDLPERLRGMFAFAIWDAGKSRLFAARDFFGIKPFYYAVIDGCFVFASEIKSILQFPGCPRKVNEEALEQYLSFQYSVLDETFFKGIYKLPPGSFLIYENGHLEIKKYFSPSLCPKKAEVNAELGEMMERTLEQSVNAHKISDVEVGAFLSGGIDSGYLAASLPGAKVFTVGFFDEQNRYSEIRQAKELAKLLGLESHTKVVTKEEFWKAVPQVMYHLDEPSGDASAVALYFVAQEAAKYVKVVMSGEGADELFGGYNIYLEPEALKWISWLPKGFRRKIGDMAKKFPDVRGRDYLIRAGASVEERYIGNASIFSTEERRELLRRDTGAVSTQQLLKDQYHQAACLDPMSKMQQIDLNTWLVGDILQKADKMSMAHSLELRVPYLDRKVFDLVKSLPVKAKVNKHKTKYLFRRIAEKKLPKKSTEVKKLGFPVPIRVWLAQEPWFSRIKETFTGKISGQFFHEEKLLKLLEEHVDGKKDNSRKIWTVYMFLVWYQVYFENQ